MRNEVRWWWKLFKERLYKPMNEMKVSLSNEFKLGIKHIKCMTQGMGG
jgi:hypothetical protein